jgi:hypothetical protein
VEREHLKEADVAFESILKPLSPKLSAYIDTKANFKFAMA